MLNHIRINGSILEYRDVLMPREADTGSEMGSN